MPRRPGFSFSDARHYLPYFLMLLVFVAGVWLVLAAGARLQPATGVPATTPAPAAATPSTSILWENFRTLLSILLTQIIVILIMAGLFRRLFRGLGQPPV